MGEYEPIHTSVWDKLDKMGYQVFQLKKANSRLRNENRALRRELAKLRKDRQKKQRYRNARHGMK